MGFLLFFAAIILSLILYPLALITSLCKNFYKRRFKEGLKQLDRQLFDIAGSIDATGNVICDDLFNMVLIRKGGYLFGNRKETVSSAIGKNQINKTLTWPGLLVAKILDTMEPGHCIKSIDNNI